MRWILTGLVVWAFAPAPAAWAYLDPGAGSLMIQVILGGIVGLLVLLRFKFRQIKKFLGIGPAGETEKTESNSDESP